MPIKAILRPIYPLLRPVAFFCLMASVASAAFSNSFFEIFSGVYLGCSLCLLLFEPRRDLWNNKWLWLAALYVLVNFLSAVQSEYLWASFRGFFRVFRCALMAMFAIYHVDTAEKLRKVFTVMGCTAFITGIDALVQGSTGFELIGRPTTPYTQEIPRVTGPFHHANDFAAYLSLNLFIFWGMASYSFKKGSLRRKLFDGTGSVVLAAGLLWTFARGAWLACGISATLMGLIRRSKAFLALLALGMALVFFFSPVSLKGRIASLWNFKDGTIHERRILWDESIRMLAERPWLGFGVNTYSKVEPQFKAKGIYTDNQYAHNGYLQIAAETGWIGLISFVAVIGGYFVLLFPSLLRNERTFTSAAGSSLSFGILSFLLHSATDTGLQSLRLVSLFWICMGLGISAIRLSRPAES